MFINKVIIIGNLTRDPEMKALPSGGKVTSFSVATNRVWKDQSGKRQEASDYHNIVVFGRQAETCAQYLKKGSQAFVEGRLQTRSWDGQDGKKQYRTEVVADRVQFGTRTGGTTGGSQTGTYQRPESPSMPEQSIPELEEINYPDDDLNPEDIPF